VDVEDMSISIGIGVGMCVGFGVGMRGVALAILALFFLCAFLLRRWCARASLRATYFVSYLYLRRSVYLYAPLMLMCFMDVCIK
jgi:hypothetical protein